jgi:glycosyltransferase involved in cell wall biosynthesis
VADVPGMTEFIENGVNGFHFARGNLGSLTGILRKVADEPNLASQMGAASSYERVPADMAYDLLGLYAAHGLVAPN